MIAANSNKHLLIYALALVGLVSLFAFARSSVTLAQNLAAYIDQAGTIETDDLGLLHPAGLAFSPEATAFFVLTTPPADQPTPATANLVLLSPYEEWLGVVNLTVSVTDPINMAFDSRANRLVLFEAATNNLVEIKAGLGGSLDPTTLTRIEAEQFGLQRPQGMTFDPGSGRLFILDAAAARIIRIEPDLAPGLDSATALKQGRISQVDLRPLGLVDAQGLAFNPTNGHLYVLSPGARRLDELTETGQLVASYDLTEFHLTRPQGMVFAPSRDNTDDPSITHLYLADSGLSVEPGQTPAPGQIVEFSFLQPVVSTFRASTVQATLVRTTKTSQFSPPSPDPSGLAYIPSSNTLLISDGEVDEMPQYFTGKNLFETTLSGHLIRTLTIVPFSYEPTGVAYNPFNHHLYFSDDTKTSGKRVYELDPGADGRYNTADDIITSFTITTFGSFDPEGIAYDSWKGHLYLSDGVNEEVYHITPGPNGRFDGPPPAGDDQVTHFDTAILGLKDPESVEFNPDNGHLYILSGKRRLIAETTTSGTLIRYISISFLTSKETAGLAYAPASNNSGEMHLYIVDRAVDNNTDPNENDGKMYEIAFPALPSAPSSVVINGPAKGVVHEGYSLTATVSPATVAQPLTYTWQAMGQATQTHTSGLSDIATFTWDTPGAQVITVTATNADGAVTGTRVMTIEAPPVSVTLSGPATGVVNEDYSFTATVSPTTVTQPLTYTWQATGQASVTHTGGLSDTVAFTWDTPSFKVITITASNGSGTPVEATSTIFIVASAEELQRVYLPLLLKDY